MTIEFQLQHHRKRTRSAAESLSSDQILEWLTVSGYYPEAYVLPPSFAVHRTPNPPQRFIVMPSGKLNGELKDSDPPIIHFPKTRYSDRAFSIVDPIIHNDISHVISQHWSEIVGTTLSDSSRVVSYSFPIPLDRDNPGVIPSGRSRSSIYQFVSMIDQDITAIAHKYKFMVRTDIKNFYPSIYTHSIPWAIHGKEEIRKGDNRYCMGFFGNQLDKLFQRMNDGRTNGIPIGPAVCDIAAELIATAVDQCFTEYVSEDKRSWDFQAIRFKDDYRILVQSEGDGVELVKKLRDALSTYSLELSDEKTEIVPIPLSMYRLWKTRYLAVYPQEGKVNKWKPFVALYLNVLEIEKEVPGSGMIDRFLGDIVSGGSVLSSETLSEKRCHQLTSMLLMLGNLRLQSFPKVLAVLECLYKDSRIHPCRHVIVDALQHQLQSLVTDIRRNRYQIIWICYFFASNGIGYDEEPTYRPSHGFSKPSKKDDDLILKSIATGSANLFSANKYTKHFKLFESPKKAGKRTTLLEHVSVYPTEPKLVRSSGLSGS